VISIYEEIASGDFMSIAIIFLSALAGLGVGLVYGFILYTHQLKFLEKNKFSPVSSLSDIPSRFFIDIVFRSAIRLAVLALVFFLILRSYYLNAMIMIVAFFISFWIVVIYKKV